MVTGIPATRKSIAQQCYVQCSWPCSPLTSQCTVVHYSHIKQKKVKKPEGQLKTFYRSQFFFFIIIFIFFFTSSLPSREQGGTAVVWALASQQWSPGLNILDPASSVRCKLSLFLVLILSPGVYLRIFQFPHQNSKKIIPFSGYKEVQVR